MKKSFIKELLSRRIPQILGSYFIASTSMILFLDWLQVNYAFPKEFITLALFGAVSILPSVHGEKVVLRLLGSGKLSLNLSNLGFPDNKLQLFRKWIKQPYGMIIVSGPTGSGKSTTLYASLIRLNTEGIQSNFSFTRIGPPIRIKPLNFFIDLGTSNERLIIFTSNGNDCSLRKSERYPGPSRSQNLRINIGNLRIL